MSKGKEMNMKKSLAFAVIGDEPTVSGLLLTGLGERHRQYGTNFMVVDKDTTKSEIEKKMNSILQRTDIGILLINQHIAEDVWEIITAHEEIFPTILEIPSKDHKYDATKDPLLVAAASQLYGADNAAEKLKFD